MVDTLRSELLRSEPAGQEEIWVVPGTLPRSLPEVHENAVLVFLLTPGLLADSAIRAYAALATGSRFPILTVSATLDSFDFSTLRDELAPLRRLNAVAWEAGDRPGSESDSTAPALRWPTAGHGQPNSGVRSIGPSRSSTDDRGAGGGGLGPRRRTFARPGPRTGRVLLLILMVDWNTTPKRFPSCPCTLR